jgi:hypothetical protein
LEGLLFEGISSIFTSTNKEVVLVVHACHPSYKGSTNRIVKVPASQGINVKLELKKPPMQKWLAEWLKWWTE